MFMHRIFVALFAGQFAAIGVSQDTPYIIKCFVFTAMFSLILGYLKSDSK